MAAVAALRAVPNLPVHLILVLGRPAVIVVVAEEEAAVQSAVPFPFLLVPQMLRGM